MIGIVPGDVAGVLAATVLQSLPPGLQEQVDLVAGSVTLERLVVFAGAGFASVTGVRWLLKRRASPEGPSGTEVRTSGDPAVATSRSSGDKSDVAFTLPWIVPVSQGIREVTHDEVHALELGFVVGVLAAWLFAIGRTRIVGTIVVVFIVAALGYRRYSSKALKTVRKEPWYGLIALLVGGSVGYWVFFAEPGVIDSVRSWIEQQP